MEGEEEDATAAGYALDDCRKRRKKKEGGGGERLEGASFLYPPYLLCGLFPGRHVSLPPLWLFFLACDNRTFK